MIKVNDALRDFSGYSDKQASERKVRGSAIVVVAILLCCLHISAFTTPAAACRRCGMFSKMATLGFPPATLCVKTTKGLSSSSTG